MREAANALIRGNTGRAKNQQLCTKNTKISMSQRDNRKSCHSDQYLAEFHQSSGTGYGTDTSFVLVSSNICCYTGDTKPSGSAAALSSPRRGSTKTHAVPSPIAERQANLPDFIALQKHHA